LASLQSRKPFSNLRNMVSWQFSSVTPLPLERES
jgi:hypothetical protein